MRTVFAALLLIGTAAADSSLYKTTDGGQSWQAVLSGITVPVASIAVDPTNKQVLYLGAGVQFYKTTDGGSDWSQPLGDGVPVTSALITSVIVDPHAPQTVYLSTFQGPGDGFPPTNAPLVMKSSDGGATWARVVSGLTAGSVAYAAYLALDPQVPATLYAATQSGLFRSTDGAASWAPTTLFAQNDVSLDPVSCVAVNPTNSATVYACANGQLMKSTDGGATWAGVTAALGSGISAFALDPQHPDRLYVALTSGIFASADGGTNWTPGTLPSSSTQIVSLLVDPVVSTRVWASSNHGLLASTDSGATWAPVMSTPFFRVTALGSDPGGALYAASDEVFGSSTTTRVDHINSAASSSGQVAPGEIVSIYGSGLASGTASYTSTPLPYQLSDASVGIQFPNGGFQSAQFFYVSPSQINLQIPFNTPVGRDALAVAGRLGFLNPLPTTIFAEIQVVPAAPAIFTVNMQGTGAGAIEHGLTYQLVTDMSPAVAGEIITIYCTGLGAVNPPVASGAAATAKTARRLFCSRQSAVFRMRIAPEIHCVS